MTTPHLKSIVKLLESCRYRHDLYTVFSDWCECAAISLSNAMDVTQREKREARYLKIVGQYERNVVETFPKIMGEVMMALEAGPQDILGSAFHELELHNTARGQFFTPYALCQMMAVMQIGDHKCAGRRCRWRRGQLSGARGADPRRARLACTNHRGHHEGNRYSD
ncbi:hypothetical protein FHT70_005563 [Rhizobium sp. BK049]|uniref:hypothetical protein n=1 Tax=Rhizobium sp. BK049 TaxID=2587095 RepID=UPI001610F5FB|nr:hypothetical protein [Rhizobium sp. BK049]MBB3355600.1 hypothetical protein [Rhizobium sp. BK049]